MRTLLHLIALVWGAAIVYRGISQGLPASPVSAYQWGGVAGFGFGVMLALVGLRHFWLRSTGGDSGLGGRGALLMVAASVAVTAGAVTWGGGARSASRECDEVLDHVQGLFAAREGAAAASARFEELRPRLLRRCQQMPSERRRCPLRATSLEEFQRCP